MAQITTASKITNTVSSNVFRVVNHKQVNIFTRFFLWCAGQESNRFLWLGLTFFGLIGMAVPCTLFAIVLFGNNSFNLWILTCAVNTPVLAITLAAQPARVMLPAFLFALFIDVMIILGCAGFYLMQ